MTFLALWEALRVAAVARHRAVWRVCGSRVGNWDDFHQPMIDAVYGPRPYDAAIRERNDE
jgi:hypothetical protein